MIIIDTIPMKTETFEQYRLRITESKNLLDLSWKDIKNLCKEHYNKEVSDNWRKYFYEFIRNNKPEGENCNRILGISDVHVPFNLPIEGFSKYSGYVDTLIINGDLLDCQSLSKFTKLYTIPIIDELKLGRQYVIDLVNLIKPKKVIAIPGNHEIRLGRLMADKLGSDITSLFPNDAMTLIFETGFNNYDHLEGTVINYKPLKDVLDCEVITSKTFWYKEGQAIFLHPMAFRQQVMATPIKAYEYFLPCESFDTIVMAHTHKVGFGSMNGKFLYEQGCCCDLKHMTYMDMKLPKERATNGYLYMVQKDGKIMYDKTRLEVI